MSSKEVFALRKAGRIQEAVAMGRIDYAANPTDSWNVKALAWSLYDAIKEAPEEEYKCVLAREFLELPGLDGDEYFRTVLPIVQQHALPYARELQQARTASKGGDWKQALRILRQIARDYPGQQTVEVAMAWELCRGIQHGLKEDKPDQLGLWDLIEGYGRLGAVPRPSDIHSRVLQWAATLARKNLAPRFCEFLKWWGPSQNLREEDLQGREKEGGGRYDSTVENVIAGVGKTIGGCESEEAKALAVEFVEQYIQRYPHQEWFPYYHATCLLAIGRIIEARALMMPVVRVKMTEFWAWEKLGLCFPENSDERLQCLCRAVVCPVKGPEFLLGIYPDLGAMLTARGHSGEGRFLLEKAKTLRVQHNWKMPTELAMALEASEGVLAVDAVPLLNELAAQADEVLLSDMPWHKGVVSSLNVEFKRDDGSKRRFHFVAVELDGQGQKRMDCRVPANKAFRALEKMPLGAAILARVDLSSERPRILSVKPRENGTPWDVYPESLGIVERVNVDRGVATVLLEHGQTALAYMNSIPEANDWTVGKYAACRFSERDGRVRVLAARIVAEPTTSPYWKEYSGEFNPRSNGPGGHVAGVFVHGRFCEGLESGQVVAGVAVRRQADNGRSWWEAISLKEQ